MSTIKSQLEALLRDIYGRRRHSKSRCKRRARYGYPCLHLKPTDQNDMRKLNDMCVLLQDEINLMACFLRQALVERQQNRDHQERLCEYVDAVLQSIVQDDVHPKMRFSLTPPPPKALHSSTITTAAVTPPRWNSRNCSSAATTTKSNDYQYQPNNNNNNSYNNSNGSASGNNCDTYKMPRQEDTNSNKPIAASQSEEESTSDYKQWLHAMKLVARLPGGIPPEFRRKLWLSLADKYLKSKNVDWSKEEEKCFCEKWREDDEELGIQIVKDLHRTGSTLCTGPAGDVNQAKLKRILLGYARYNPEVGYCQGFNMLGALILQVMDKEEAESMKVMIYLVEGILPPGYFCGSMGGLQADMAVFRELMQTKLPRLARHLQKLQGPVENAFEPPLTNVFTMQWFLTMFCTCLPMSCVLRVWDLVLIEGSDVLLRTALALWSLLEDRNNCQLSTIIGSVLVLEVLIPTFIDTLDLFLFALLRRVLSTRSADDFYGKMGSFSSELLNGHLIDSNGLIEKVVQLGPIQDIQKLRDKHLYSVMPLKNKQGLNFYYDDDEPDMDEDSRLAVATVWGIPWGRRGSQGQTANTIAKQAVESKDRIALDISLLKKQYDRLRERQKQAHIILTTACSTARQSTGSSAVSATLPVNQLLSGRPAIITNRGRRSGPPIGAIPPARKPSLPAVLQDKPLEKQLRRGETLQWRDSTLDSKRRRDSLSWKEIRAERAAMISSGSIDGLKSQKIRTKRLGKSDSSSYSEESDDEDSNDKAASSSDTSLCDDDNQPSKSGRKYLSSLKNKSKAVLLKQKKLGAGALDNGDRQRPKSWAPSNSDIPFVLMTTDSPNNSADEGVAKEQRLLSAYVELSKEEENSATESDQIQVEKMNGSTWHGSQYSPLAEDIAVPKLEPLLIDTDLKKAPTSSDVMHITPPIADVVEILAMTKALTPPTKTHLTESTNSLGSGDGDADAEDEKVKVSDEGVTNEYFERVNSTERPTKLELMYSLNEEDSIRDAYKEGANVDDVEAECKSVHEEHVTNENQSRCMDLLVDYSEKSSAACIAEAKTEISSSLQMSDYSHKSEQPSTTYTATSAANKRKDPRRLTLTRSSTMDIEKRYQALEKRLSMEVSSKYKVGPHENHSDTDKYRSYHTNPNPHLKEEEKPYEHYRIPHPVSSNYSIQYQEDEEVKETPKPIDFPLQRKHIIPSTADLEERFENMIRDRSKQVSAVNDSEKSGTSRKTPPPSPRESSANGSSKNVDKRQESNKNANVAPKNSAAQEDAASKRMHSDRESDDVDDVDERDIEDEDNSNRQTYSEVESQSNVSKSNSLQRKKEPPERESDEPDYGHKQGSNETNEGELSDEEIDRSATVSGNDSPVVDSEPEMPHEEDEPEEELTASRRQSELSSTSQRQSELMSRRQSELTPPTSRRQSELATTSRRNEMERSEKSSKITVVKKSPPSTEELEKRFDALEKQMSISRSEASEEPHEESMHKPNLEYDDRQSPDGFSEIDQQIMEDESQKSAAGSETADEGTEDLSRANRIKASVIEAMKSSAAHISEDDGHNRSSKMAANVMDAMRSSKRRSDDERSARPTQPSATDDDSESVNRSNRIKANVIEAMKSSSVLPSPDEGSETTKRSNKMAANVMAAMKSAAHHPEDDDEDAEKRRRSNKIKADVIEAMKSSSALPSPDEASAKANRSNKIVTNVMDAMKSSLVRHSPDDSSEKRSRSNRIKAGVLEAMTSSSSVRPSPDEDLETTSRSSKMATNVMAAMKSSPVRHSDDDDEASAKRSRSDKIKADVIAAMKSSSEHPSPGETSSKMATNVREAMKSSVRRSAEETSATSSRSKKMATNVMDAMKSSARRSDDTGREKHSRSDKIKAEVIAAMKSSSAHPSPDEDPETPNRSIKMDVTKTSSRRDEDADGAEKLRRSNKIKAEVIEAMKSSSDRHSPDEGSENRRTHKMATNVMDAMKSSVRRSGDVDTQKLSRSNKMATNVMEAMKSSPVRQSPDEAAEKLSRSNKIKADVIEAMKSSSSRPSHDEDSETPSRSTRMATNVMEAMKSSAARTSAKSKSSKIVTPEDSETSNKTSTNVAEAPTSSGRRSSEPPSTEDLEKRYEVLKRRMSSRNFDTNKGKRNTSEYSADIAEGTDEPFSAKDATSKTSPPSTDSLERRFEKLQNESESGKSKIDDKGKSQEKGTVKRTPSREQSSSSKQSPIESEKTSSRNVPKDSASDEGKLSTEQSPTEGKKTVAAKQSPNQEPGGRSALIEELQSKLGVTPDGENIKPSSINPNRKPPPPPPPYHPLLRKSKTDETSETHATHANSISGKYEPIHSSSRKMVRRFSDVPSRADLENRLQFLEEQLSKTLLKQRRASDSEVASTSRNQHAKPITATLRHVGKLESRVQELEKHLSSSSKFKVSTKDQKNSTKPEPSSSQMGLEITTDSVDITGKELVRYSHFGEVDEHDFLSPINISINIHMTLSKDDLGKTATQHLTRADELSRRLLILEQQLKTSQRNIASSSTPIDSHVDDNPLPTSQNAKAQEDEILPTEYEVRIENEEHIIDEPAKETAHIAERVSEITPECDIPIPHSKPQTAEQMPEAPDNVAIAEPEPTKQSTHTSEPIKEPEPVVETTTLPTETVVETPIDIPEEAVTKEVYKKQENTPKEEDFDRRLQILEQHMKNSQNISTPETHKVSLPAPKDTKEETPNSSRITQQAKPETPKIETEKRTEEGNIDPRSTKADKQKAESAINTVEADGESKLDTDSENKAIPSKQPQETEAQISNLPLESLNASQMVPVEVNKKTLVLLLDNEPKAVKVRRLTRANTEELEDLFQALEKQLIERGGGQIKPEDLSIKDERKDVATKSTLEMADLTKEIMQLSKSAKAEEDHIPTATKTARKEEDFDWGRDPVKHHLKKKTVYLPSTRELESRFRSLERQIKQLEDVEKIDVEQRLTEIERKIKLQYSLSHEKDLNRFLDLCEGKGLDDTPTAVETPVAERRECSHTHSEHSHCAHAKKHQSPVRMIEPERMECSHTYSEHSHCGAPKKHQSPVRVVETKSSAKPTTEDLEYRFRALDLKKTSRPKPSAEMKREPIHPLEMLLDPSPEDIPTTGELEHRMRMLDEGRSTPSPSSRKSRSKSPVVAGDSKHPEQRYESPSPSGLPTAQELEARLEALEKEQRFDFKMQKNYKQFNQKLKDIISPSLSFEEFKATRSSSAESATKNVHRSPSPKVTISCTGDAACTRTIRFHEDEQHQRSRPRNDSEAMVSTDNDVIQILEENSNIIQRILKKTIADSHGCGGALASSVPAHLAGSVQEGLGVMGIRLMRETSPLRRKGTHTGVPLRTGENINDQLTSIKNTIKSIDSLCEEKPYRTERCQQYIDSLCSDSSYFASKKSSYDDLTSRHLSRSRSREYGGPSIRISDQSPAFIRSMGSADSIRSASPLRPTSPLQYHSNRDLRREISPRRRRDEEREENESRVRRDNLLPNIYNTYNHSSLSQCSHSLTKFHKVDSQLISNDVDDIDVELQQTYRQPTTFSSNETTSIHDSNTNTSNTANNTTTLTNVVPNTTNDTTFKSSILDRPMSPYRQIGLARSNTPVYSPAKLEIRHTTVTSTFYDRVLAEKQLEKKHSTNTTNTATTTTTTTTTNVPANRSPLLEQPPVIRPTDKYSPPKFPYSETAAAVAYNAATNHPNTAATTGNYGTYQPPPPPPAATITLAKPSPVLAKAAIPESPIISSYQPKT